MREADLARSRQRSAADERVRRCRVVRSAETAGQFPAARSARGHSPMRWWATSSASLGESGGNSPGSRWASMVLPEPGGPHISRLWNPAARDEERTFGQMLSANVGEVGRSRRRSGSGAVFETGRTLWSGPRAARHADARRLRGGCARPGACASPTMRVSPSLESGTMIS